jgi:LysM repeat protein
MMRRLALVLIMAATTAACISNPTRTDITHVVEPGESLSKISALYTGSPDHYRAIAAHNGIRNPKKIEVGQAIIIPASLLNQDATSTPIAGSARAKTASSAKTDTARTVTEGAVTGGVVGAGLGAVACKDKRGQCAALGGAIGALGGAIAGSLLAATKQDYVDIEERLNQEIAHAKQYNRELKGHNVSLAAEIKSLNAELRRLQRRYRSGQVQASELASQKQRVNTLLVSNEKLLTDSRKELSRQEDNYRDFTKPGSSSLNAGKLKSEVALLRTNIDRLDKETRKLASINNDRLST